MNYPVNTSLQLRAVLRALRRSRGFSQAEVGRLLGVNQKRVAQIELAPGVTSFAQISRLVAALGGRLTIADAAIPARLASRPTRKGKIGRQPAKATASTNW